jgi:hypothetical protein
LVRRIGAVAVLIALVWGSVRLVGAAFGGTSPEAEASETPTATGTAETSATPSESSEVTASSAVVTVDPAAPSTVGAPTSSIASVPSAADPALVWIAGDSDAGTFGPYLETLVGQTGVATTSLDYKVSSGLSRPDFFDWPSHFRSQIPVVQPDIVVATFGGNDAQGLARQDGSFIVGTPTGEAGGDLEWREEYGRRVGETMDLLSADGRTLIWVGIPNDDNPEVTARMAVQNEVVQAEAAERPGVVFVDTWKRFSGRDGNWAEYVIDPRDGQGKDVRADDGFHLNETGAEILALDIAEAVRAELRARGATF